MNHAYQERKRLTEVEKKPMWQFSNKKADLVCVKAMMPDLELSNSCRTVLKSILAHCDECVGWQLRTCWNAGAFHHVY